LNAEDATVAHVVSIREEVVAAPEVVAAVEAAPATEPEVAKKGKPEADAGAKKADSGPGAKK
jgi:large subunit ribosomal protein L25